MPTATANGIELFYEEFGEGAPILGVHGTPSSAILWEEAARKLGELGRCLIYDRRGFGRSPEREPLDSSDLNRHLDDAVALLDVLSASPAIVIGRGTGGLSPWRSHIVIPRRCERWSCSNPLCLRLIPRPTPGLVNCVATCWPPPLRTLPWLRRPSSAWRWETKPGNRFHQTCRRYFEQRLRPFSPRPGDWVST